jgi:hypothetical protein
MTANPHTHTHQTIGLKPRASFCKWIAGPDVLETRLHLLWKPNLKYLNYRHVPTSLILECCDN